MNTTHVMNLLINNDVGLHARPATLFVQTAMQFNARVMVTHKDHQSDGKSLLGLLALGVSKGSSITIEAEGEDADLALQSLKALVENDFEVTSPNVSNGKKE